MYTKTGYYMKYSAYSDTFSPLHFKLYCGKSITLWDSVAPEESTVYNKCTLSTLMGLFQPPFRAVKMALKVGYTAPVLMRLLH